MKKLNNFEKWVINQKLWVTILLVIFTYFIWLFIYLYCKYKEKSIIENIKENSTIQETQSEQEKQSSKFECILENVNKYDCHSLIGTLLYFKLLDKNDLYDGYSDNEIKDYGFKVYECNDCTLPCEIKWDEKSGIYKIVYNEHSSDYCFGNIPKEYNKKINDIINYKNITYGGISFKNGYYKKYDENKNEIVKGYDNYIVKLYLDYNSTTKEYTLSIAGLKYNNDDGTNRLEILKKCISKNEIDIKLETYKYKNEDAIKIMSKYGQIGNIYKTDLHIFKDKLNNIESCYIKNINDYKNIKIYIKFKN